MKRLLIIILLIFSFPGESQLNKNNEILYINVGGKQVIVEIANTESKRRMGLMYRKSLGKSEGMLFIFPKPDYLSFWMKNTTIPLSIAFFNQDKRLIDIYEMKPNQTKEVYNSTEKAVYALEMNSGWFEQNKIGKFAVLELPKVLTGN